MKQKAKQSEEIVGKATENHTHKNSINRYENLPII